MYTQNLSFEAKLFLTPVNHSFTFYYFGVEFGLNYIGILKSISHVITSMPPEYCDFTTVIIRIFGLVWFDV